MENKTVYIASCSPEGGIAHCVLDREKQLKLQRVTPLDRPMFLAKDGDCLWATLREPAGFQGSSVVCKIHIEQDGALSEPEMVGSTHGQVACHLFAEQGNVFCVNYLSGNVVKLPDTVVAHTGSGPNGMRQQSPHTHFIGAVPGSSLLCVTDLGTDSICFYDRSLKEQGKIRVPAGHGARHIVFSPDGGYLYCVNELVPGVSVFYRAENQWVYHSSVSTLPEKYGGQSEAAAIRISQDGRYLYVSNRGHNSIAWLACSGERLTLCGTVSCEGDWPRDVNLYDNSVLLCANERSNTVTVFTLEQGKPVFTGNELSVAAPLCLL